MYTLLVRFDLPDLANADAFDALVEQVVPVIRERESGTLVYDPYEVDGEPLARVFFEVYADAEAHAAHEQQPHTVAFLAAIRDLTSHIRVERLTV